LITQRYRILRTINHVFLPVWLYPATILRSNLFIEFCLTAPFKLRPIDGPIYNRDNWKLLYHRRRKKSRNFPGCCAMNRHSMGFSDDRHHPVGNRDSERSNRSWFWWRVWAQPGAGHAASSTPELAEGGLYLFNFCLVSEQIWGAVSSEC